MSEPRKSLSLWSHAALSLCLLTACGGRPMLESRQANPLDLSVQNAEILPGSKGGILPGSKGDRTHLASLELELNLPLDTAFSLAQLTQSEAESWSAEIDGLRPARIRLLRARPGGDGQVLTFVLEGLSLLPEDALHELVFYSAEGVVQAAVLTPLSAGLTRLAEPLTSASLADWLIARKLQRGQPLQQLAPAVLTQVRNSPEAKALTQELKRLYRQSNGKSDPRKSVTVDDAAEAAAQKHINNNPAFTAGAADDPVAAPSKNPQADIKPGQIKQDSPEPSATPTPEKSKNPNAGIKPGQIKQDSPEPSATPTPEKSKNPNAGIKPGQEK